MKTNVTGTYFRYMRPNQTELFMISQSEVKSYISSEIPALANDLACIKRSDCYNSIERLTNYTKQIIQEGEAWKIKQCFETAHDLMDEGDRLVQLIMENVFIFSVSRLLEISISVTQPVRKLFLENFKMQYIKQINSKYP